MPKKKTEVLVFQQYWERYSGMDGNIEIAARRAWTFGVLQTQRIYLPVVQENEKLKKELAELKSRRTSRALDGARFCPECKALLEEGSVYCDTCGTDTPRQ